MNSTRIAVVTGVSRGFGRSIAAHLVASGVKVIGTFNSGGAQARELAEQITLTGAQDSLALLSLDVTHTDRYDDFANEVSRRLERWGADRFDYLVNNAGIGVFAPYAQTSQDQFDEVIAVNLKAPFFLTQRLLPLLNDGGRILNVSTALTRAVVPSGSAYAASKGAVEVLTRYLAVELADRGIRVNTIVGGATDGGFGGGIMRSEAVQKQATEVIALGRIGTPDDLGAAVPSILSDAFGWVTGACIDVNGGQSL